MSIRNVLVECDACKKVAETGKEPAAYPPQPRGWFLLRYSASNTASARADNGRFSLCSEKCLGEGWRLWLDLLNGMSGGMGPSVTVTIERNGISRGDGVFEHEDRLP